MSIAGFQRGGIVALTLAAAMLAGQEADASVYYRETAPLTYDNTRTASPGRGLEMTVHETFSVSAIEVWAHTGVSSSIETQFKIFELEQPGEFPGQEDEVFAITDAHATDNTWDWIRFDINYTFVADTNYVLYWYGLGSSLPSEAGGWNEGNSHPEFSVLAGMTGANYDDDVPTESNLVRPLFRLEIPEPSTAALALTMGGALLLRRQRYR